MPLVWVTAGCFGLIIDTRAGENFWEADFVEPLSASGPPVIIESTGNQQGLLGETATFSVVASGATPLHYQWRRNQSNLSGQTNNWLVLSNLTAGTAGDYRVIVTNSSGRATSAVATLTVSMQITQSFSFPGPIEIVDSGPANFYPAVIQVSGVSGVIARTRVTLRDVSYAWPDDLDVLLVAPGGQRVLLMSDAGYGYGMTNLDLAFADRAIGYMGDFTAVGSGSYRPTAYETNDVLPAPAPSPPYGALLSSFNGTDPNGDWQLFVCDDTMGFGGLVANGWELEFILAGRSQAVDHYEFDSVGPVQTADVPFLVSITAKDAANHTLTNFAGMVSLTAFAEASAKSFFGSTEPNQSYTGGSFTDAYEFTPNTNICVTHFRHYYGDKVSLWAADGVLLASQMVVSQPGNWVETPLVQPILLLAGASYRLGVYYENPTANSYYRVDMGNSFSQATLTQSYYALHDEYPTNSESIRWYFVDVRYVLPVNFSAQAPGLFTNGVSTATVTAGGAYTNMVLRVEDTLGHTGTSNPFQSEVWQLQFANAPGSLQMSNGVFQFRLEKLWIGRTQVIEASSNLINWTPIFTNTLATNSLIYLDRTASNQLWRFYRALEK